MGKPIVYPSDTSPFIPGVFLKLHFLGTTGYHPNNQRQTACFMLPEIGVILDAGTGMFRARDLIQTSHLDIFLSHIHLDHSIGLTFLFDVLFGKDIQRVTVHCTDRQAEALSQHLFHKLLFPVQPEFEYRHYGDQPIELADGSQLTAFPLEHPGGAHGFRIDWPDRSLAYITDTTAAVDAAYLNQIRGVDTLIHECYFPDGWESQADLTGHSCLTPVAHVARAAEVGKLYLVHINPLNESEQPLDLDSVAEIYSNIEIPSDQLVVEL